MTQKVKPQQAREKTRKRRFRGRGALWVIALLFALSGAFRLSLGAGQAIAREVANLGAGSTEVGGPPASCSSEQDIEIVLTRLRQREAKSATREAAIDDRLQALAVAEAQIEKNLSALIKAEAALEATMALADSAAEDDLVRLTSVYENMKPKDAALLFEAMAPEFAAGFMGRMRADSAAAVMAGLDPQTAYMISVVLAGRNANVPTN